MKQKGNSFIEKYLFFLTIIFLLSLITQESFGAQKNQDISMLQKETRKLEAEIQKINDRLEKEETYKRIYDEYQNKLSSDRINHQSFLENIYANFISYLQFIIGTIVIVVGVGSYFWGKSAKETIKALVNKSSEKAQKEIDEEVDRFKQSLISLKEDLENEKAYKNQNLGLFKTKQATELLKEEVGFLRKIGFNIQNFTSHTDINFNSIIFHKEIVEEIDILIISISKDDNLISLFESLDNALAITSNKIPIIFYTKENSPTFRELSAKYPWVLCSQMPLTLLTSILNVTKLKSLI